MIKVKRLIKSFKYAFKGFAKTVREEQNLHIQFTATVLVVILALYYRLSAIEWAVLILVIGMVIITEILNSAVERVSDVLKPRISSYVKEIKDIMAAAVMLASLIAIIVGLIIFLPYVLRQ